MAAWRGFDLLELTPSRFCNAIIQWYVERVKHPEEWLAKLRRPPPEELRAEKISDEVVEEERAQFAAFAAAFGVKAPDADATA